MELFDNEAFEALFRKENNAGHLTVSCERISQTRQSPWKAAKHRCTRRPKKRVAKSSKPKPKQKVKRKKVPPRKRQDKQQRAMMKLQEAHEKILAKPQPKLWTQAAYHLPGLIPFNGVGSNIQKARRAAALEMISLLRRNLTTEEEFQSKRTLENMLSCKIDKARKHCNWIGKDFRKSLPPDLKEAFSEKGLHNAFFLAWLNLKDKPVELQDEIELMQRVRNISVENGYMPRRRDPEGFCRFYAFGKAVYDYLAYAGNERSDLTKAAAKVEKLIKDAQETSKEEKRDMRRRLQACSDRFCILVGGPEFLCEAGVRMNLSRTIQVLSRTGSLKTADHLRERHNYAWMVLPFIKNSVGRELGPEKDFGLEFCGSGRTRTDIKGSDMDVFLFAKSSSSVSEEMMGKLWASLMGRCRKYNKYGTVLPSHPPALTDFRDKSPKPRPRPHSTALTTSPRGSALRILAKGRANKDVDSGLVDVGLRV